MAPHSNGTAQDRQTIRTGCYILHVNRSSLHTQIAGQTNKQYFQGYVSTGI